MQTVLSILTVVLNGHVQLLERFETTGNLVSFIATLLSITPFLLHHLRAPSRIVRVRVGLVRNDWLSSVALHLPSTRKVQLFYVHGVLVQVCQVFAIVLSLIASYDTVRSCRALHNFCMFATCLIIISGTSNFFVDVETLRRAIRVSLNVRIRLRSVHGGAGPIHAVETGGK